MKSYLLISLITILIVPISQSIDFDCYWDSDCSEYGCCQNRQCMPKEICSDVRAFPKNLFSICFASTDCISGCCHNNFCTMLETCDPSDSSVVLIVFIVIVGLLLILLGFLLVRDILINKNVREHQAKLRASSRGNSRVLGHRKTRDNNEALLHQNRTVSLDHQSQSVNLEQYEQKREETKQNTKYGIQNEDEDEISYAFRERENSRGRRESNSLTKRYLPNAPKPYGVDNTDDY